MEEGERILEDVLKEDSENTQANNDLGYLWADQGKNLKQARAMIEKAIEAEPDNPAYLDSMGWVLFKLGQYQEAHKFLKQASEHEDGEDSTIFDHLGDSLVKLGKTQEAQDAWQKALELEQDKKHPSEKLLKSLLEKTKDSNDNPSSVAGGESDFNSHCTTRRLTICSSIPGKAVRLPISITPAIVIELFWISAGNKSHLCWTFPLGEHRP